MNLSEWVVVFDLDDTLYSEFSYQLSGIVAVEELLSDCFNRSFQGILVAAHQEGVDDLWGWACRELELPADVATSLLWAYRLHRPQLSLDPEVEAVLAHLRAAGASLAVLTDGRSLSQRLKLVRLGLADLPAFISEEYGAAKPDPGRYEAIQRQWPQRRYAYVADNPAKDFLAPNRLGWLSVGLRSQFPTVHGQDTDGPEELQPQHWIDRLSGLPELLIATMTCSGASVALTS